MTTDSIKFQVMDRTGHSTEVFERATAEDLTRAQEKFDQLIADGHTAARRDGPGQLTQIRSFDPGAEETVFFPPLQGG
jgi:hypothetical protein